METKPNPAGLMTFSEAAEYLNVSERWMLRYKTHGIPYVKLGRFTFFLISDLDTFISSHRKIGW